MNDISVLKSSWQNTTIIIRYRQVCRIYNTLSEIWHTENKLNSLLAWSSSGLLNPTQPQKQTLLSTANLVRKKARKFCKNQNVCDLVCFKSTCNESPSQSPKVWPTCVLKCFSRDSDAQNCAVKVISWSHLTNFLGWPTVWSTPIF